jgi:hypothetical protein
LSTTEAQQLGFMMGRLFDQFGSLRFSNEAEVSQNFVIPLFIEFLGYNGTEILPEHRVPAFDIPQNRNRAVSSEKLPLSAKPDFVIAIDSEHKLVCDSKAPNEDLNKYIEQLKAYCIGLGLNLLIVTNGTEFRVYDANRLVFQALNIGEVDQKFDELAKLLSRQNVVAYSDIERLQLIDISIARMPLSHSTSANERIAIINSDFKPYLHNIMELPQTLKLPNPITEAFNFSGELVPAEKIYTFDIYTTAGIR